MASSGTADLLQEEKEEGYIPAKELVGWQPLQQAIQELVPGAPVNTATAPERLASVLRSLDGVQQRVTAVAATNIEMCLLLSSAADEIESWLNECASTPIKPGTQPGRTVLNKMLRAAGHKAIGEAWRHTGSLWQTAADRAWWTENLSALQIKSFNQLRALHAHRTQIVHAHPDIAARRKFWTKVLSAKRNETDTLAFIKKECPSLGQSQQHTCTHVSRTSPTDNRSVLTKYLFDCFFVRSPC